MIRRSGLPKLGNHIAVQQKRHHLRGGSSTGPMAASSSNARLRFGVDFGEIFATSWPCSVSVAVFAPWITGRRPRLVSRRSSVSVAFMPIKYTVFTQAQYASSTWRKSGTIRNPDEHPSKRAFLSNSEAPRPARWQGSLHKPPSASMQREVQRASECPPRVIPARVVSECASFPRSPSDFGARRGRRARRARFALPRDGCSSRGRCRPT